jgi:hypothetical protein
VEAFHSCTIVSTECAPSYLVALTVDWDDQSDNTTEDPVLDLADVCDQSGVVHYTVEDFARGHFGYVIVGGVVGLVVRLRVG